MLILSPTFSLPEPCLFRLGFVRQNVGVRFIPRGADPKSGCAIDRTNKNKNPNTGQNDVTVVGVRAVSQQE